MDAEKESELAIKLKELQIRRRDLGVKKGELEVRISELNSEVRLAGGVRYREIVTEQNIIKKQIVDVNNESNQVKTEFIEIDTLLHQTRHSEAVVQAAARILMDAVLNLLQDDPHQWSSRPCKTCKTIGSIIGRQFGCYLYKERIISEPEF